MSICKSVQSSDNDDDSVTDVDDKDDCILQAHQSH